MPCTVRSACGCELLNTYTNLELVTTPTDMDDISLFRCKVTDETFYSTGRIAIGSARVPPMSPYVHVNAMVRR